MICQFLVVRGCSASVVIGWTAEFKTLNKLMLQNVLSPLVIGCLGSYESIFLKGGCILTGLVDPVTLIDESMPSNIV